MQRYIYPAVIYVAAVIVLLANLNAGPMAFAFTPVTVAIVLMAIALIWWVVATVDAPGPAWRQALLVALPAVPPVAMATAAYVDADAAAMGIFRLWPLTILTPGICLVGLFAVALRRATQSTGAD